MNSGRTCESYLVTFVVHNSTCRLIARMMIINLQNLHFSYPESQGKRVLDVPSWSVAAQEHVFVHGPSGGGKSTLLNLLSGIYKPSGGELSVMDCRLDSMSRRQRDQFRAMHIGYVFQQFNLIPYLNPVENIQLATQFAKRESKSASIKEIEALLERLKLPAADHYKPASQLSIGQQQRVAIARALINKPQLLIADEPTSSLDQKNRDNFMSVLMSLVDENNITLVFVSHDMSLSKYFNRIDALSDINRLGEEV